MAKQTKNKQNKETTQSWYCSDPGLSDCGGRKGRQGVRPKDSLPALLSQLPTQLGPLGPWTFCLPCWEDILGDQLVLMSEMWEAIFPQTGRLQMTELEEQSQEGDCVPWPGPGSLNIHARPPGSDVHISAQRDKTPASLGIGSEETK